MSDDTLNEARGVYANTTNASAVTTGVSSLASPERRLAHLVADVRNGFANDEEKLELAKQLFGMVTRGDSDGLATVAERLQNRREGTKEHLVHQAIREFRSSKGRWPVLSELKNHVEKDCTGRYSSLPEGGTKTVKQWNTLLKNSGAEGSIVIRRGRRKEI